MLIAGIICFNWRSFIWLEYPRETCSGWSDKAHFFHIWNWMQRAGLVGTMHTTHSCRGILLFIHDTKLLRKLTSFSYKFTCYNIWRPNLFLNTGNIVFFQHDFFVFETLLICFELFLVLRNISFVQMLYFWALNWNK